METYHAFCGLQPWLDTPYLTYPIDPGSRAIRIPPSADPMFSKFPEGSGPSSLGPPPTASPAGAATFARRGSARGRVRVAAFGAGHAAEFWRRGLPWERKPILGSQLSFWTHTHSSTLLGRQTYITFNEVSDHWRGVMF